MTNDAGEVVVVGHPEAKSMVAPRHIALDPRLSARAKGLMFIMVAFPQGYAPSTERLLPYCKEGRDAVRAALSELEAAGYITRKRQQLDGGRWTTVTTLYPYGQPTPDFQASVGPTPDFQALSSTSLGGTTSKEVAAADNIDIQPLAPIENLDDPQQPVEDAPTPPVTARNQGVPWTEVHLLKTWFNVTKQEQVDAWQAAWRTGCDMAGVDFDPQIHLVAYLTRCRHEKREPKPSLWLRFLGEDKQHHLAERKAHEDRLEQAGGDGGEAWALQSLKRTPKWEAGQQ